MLKRILTAIVLIVLMGLGIWFLGWPLRLILLIGMLASTYEVYAALRKAGSRPAAWTGYVYCAVAVLAQAMRAERFGPAPLLRLLDAVSPPAFSLAVGLLLAMTVIVLEGEVAYDRMVSTLFPMLYPGLLFALLLTLQDLSTRTAATLALVLTFFIASVNDTFALFIGLRFGRHRLSPKISPKKSVEGSVAGLASSVLFAMLVPWVTTLLAPRFPGLAAELQAAPLPQLWAFAILGLAAGALSQIGDLVASLVKRHCGVKDYGSIFPGHGGMLDRLDGILFCGAACWAFFLGAGL